MKKALLLAVVLSGIMLSCKKNDDKHGEATCYLTSYTVYSLDNGIMDTTITEITFNENRQLSTINDGYMERRMIYDNDRLIRQEYAVNGQTPTFCDYSYDTSTGKLVFAVCNGFNGIMYDDLTYFEYSFIGDQLVEVAVVDSFDHPINNYTTSYTYDNNMNITQSVRRHYNATTNSNSDSIIFNYIYDNARAPYEGYPFPVTTGSALVNNRLSTAITYPDGSSISYNYVYTYNEYNYPILREDSKDGSLTRKVVYHYSCDE